MIRVRRPLLGVALFVSGACRGTEPSPSVPAGCEAPATVTLAAGEHQVVDANLSRGCVRLPSPAGGASYLLGLVSGAGRETQTGVSASYYLQIGPAGTVGLAGAARVVPDVLPGLAREEAPLPLRFHQFLRDREREFAARREWHLRPPDAAAALAPPEVGSERRFAVCRNTQCNQFDSVTAVARAVGQKVAVYLDLDAPDFDPLQQADLDELRRTFDDYHHPIVAQAFGAESDIDGNGVAIVLLTPGVNRLTTNCSQGRIIGFFWPGDLLTIAGSNRGEIFYALVPAPATPTCGAATRVQVKRSLKPVLIHEFQHMVNYNQKVLVRGGLSSEETWLNEGLSHYAEELGGRLIPPAECPEVQGPTPCRSLYIAGNFLNLWDYLTNTEASHLVIPRNSTGTLAERGAGWTFVRWLADHFGSDSVGFDLTRRLTQTALLGSANVEAATGLPFARAVGEWFLAVYLDDLPGFTPASTRLLFRWWNFRATFANNCCAEGSPFPSPYPFTPPVAAGPFAVNGTLRGGSGRYVEVRQDAGGPGFDVLVARQAGGLTLDASIAARVTVARLR